MTQDEEPPSDQQPKKALNVAWKALNIIAAVLTLVALAAAIWIPPAIGRGGTPTERTWQAAGVAVFLVGLFAVIKKINFSLIYLCLACAFFFVSCAANFHWKGG